MLDPTILKDNLEVLESNILRRNLKIDVNPMYRVEEGVVTPNGTTIRRRRIEV